MRGLRRTFAVGHSNLSTTQIYTQVSPEQLSKVTSPLDVLYERR